MLRTGLGAGTLGHIVAAIVGWWLPLIGLGLLIALLILWIVTPIDKGIMSQSDVCEGQAWRAARRVPSARKQE